MRSHQGTQVQIFGQVYTLRTRDDAERVRREINECLDLADGCIVEMILKDTHTVRDDPDALSNWVTVAKEVTAARA